jgi:hypothetical protein
MNAKRLLAIALLLLCTSSFIAFTKGNPVILAYFPTEPNETPPSITINFPIQNTTYNSTNISLNFTVTKPESYFGLYTEYQNMQGKSQPLYLIFGKVTAVYYTVDNGANNSITVNDVDSFATTDFPPRTFNFNIILNLTTGQHFVKVGVEAVTYYVSGGSIPPISFVVQAHSDPVNFSVEIPKPVIIAPVHKVYNETSVPLVFTVDKSATWVGYSLDGKDNVSIAGNTTLTGLSNGEYNITVYANDTFGNISASQTVNFTVALPPEMEPFPTMFVAVASIATIAVVGVGVLVYFKKRKH